MDEESKNDTGDAISQNKFEEVSSVSCNPTLPNELEGVDIAKMKGDAIGDTLYSERFVLSTLIKLTKEVELNKDFEDDLCTLWDMTIEKDVVLLLLEHNTLEIIEKMIICSSDPRLIEILLGIVGNMAFIEETRQKLSVDSRIMKTLLETIHVPDPLTLIQLMRFFSSVLIFENTGDENIWFQHFQAMPDFLNTFSSILHNSKHSALLSNALEALMAMCSKFSILEMSETTEELFVKMFVIPNIISGIIDAFQQLIPVGVMDNSDDTNIPTEKQEKIIHLFLEINSILSQCGTRSTAVYDMYLPDMLNCINVILLPLTNNLYLLPLCQDNLGILEHVVEILSNLQTPFNGEIITNLYRILKLVTQEVRKLSSEDCAEPGWEDCDSNGSMNANSCGTNMCLTITEFFIKIVQKASQENLGYFLKAFPIETATDFVKEIGPNKQLEKCDRDRLLLAFKKTWNVDIEL